MSAKYTTDERSAAAKGVRTRKKMSIKIDAPRAWAWDDADGRHASPYDDGVPSRIVRESDWRRVMAVVRAAEQDALARTFRQHDQTPSALNVLRKHLEKRKEQP